MNPLQKIEKAQKDIVKQSALLQSMLAQIDSDLYITFHGHYSTVKFSIHGAPHFDAMVIIRNGLLYPDDAATLTSNAGAILDELNDKIRGYW